MSGYNMNGYKVAARKVTEQTVEVYIWADSAEEAERKAMEQVSSWTFQWSWGLTETHTEAHVIGEQP